MALITLPTGGKRTIEWTQPEWAAFTVRSGWTGGQTIGDLGGTRDGWKAKVEIIPGRAAHRTAWLLFTTLLKGPVNTFRLPIVEADQHAGTYTISVQGYVAGGLDLFVSDAAFFGTLITAGQLISVPLPSGKEQVLVLSNDLSFNGPGPLAYHATALFVEPLRETPALNATVTTKRPNMIMKMVSGPFGFTVSPGQIYQPGGFSAEEVR